MLRACRIALAAVCCVPGLPGAAHSQNDGVLSGMVWDSTRSAPLSKAIVYIEGTDFSGVTDSLGRFTVPHGLTGRHTVRFFHASLGSLGLTTLPGATVRLGADARTDVTLAVPSLLTLRAAQIARSRGVDVYALDPIRVEVTSQRTARRRASGASFDLVSRADIEALETSARNVGDLIRMVRSINVVEGEHGELCIQSRRMTTFTDPGDGPCARMVPVYVDGLLIPSPETYIDILTPQDIDSIEFLSGIDATTRYGTNATWGVLLITTRGARR
jgi:hypothetical protein